MGRRWFSLLGRQQGWQSAFERYHSTCKQNEGFAALQAPRSALLSELAEKIRDVNTQLKHQTEALFSLQSDIGDLQSLIAKTQTVHATGRHSGHSSRSVDGRQDTARAFPWLRSFSKVDSVERQSPCVASQPVLASSFPATSVRRQGFHVKREIDLLAYLFTKGRQRTRGSDMTGRRPGISKNTGLFAEEHLGSLKSQMKPIDRGKMQHQPAHSSMSNLFEDTVSVHARNQSVGRSVWSAGLISKEKMESGDLETTSALVNPVQELVEVLNMHRKLRMSWWKQSNHKGTFSKWAEDEEVMFAQMHAKAETGLGEAKVQNEEYNLHTLEAAGIPCGAVYCALDVNEEGWQCFPLSKLLSLLDILEVEFAHLSATGQPVQVAAAPKDQTTPSTLSGCESTVEACSGMEDLCQPRESYLSKCSLEDIEDFIAHEIDGACGAHSTAQLKLQGDVDKCQKHGEQGGVEESDSGCTGAQYVCSTDVDNEELHPGQEPSLSCCFNEGQAERQNAEVHEHWDTISYPDRIEGDAETADVISDVDAKVVAQEKEAFQGPSGDNEKTSHPVEGDCREDLVHIHGNECWIHHAAVHPEKSRHCSSQLSRSLEESGESAGTIASHKEHFCTGNIQEGIQGSMHKRQLGGISDNLDSARTTGSIEIIDDGSDTELDCLSEIDFLSSDSTRPKSPRHLSQDDHRVHAVCSTTFGNPLFVDDLGHLEEHFMLPPLSQSVNISSTIGLGTNAPESVCWYPVDNPLFIETDELEFGKENKQSEPQQLEGEQGRGRVDQRAGVFTRLVSIQKAAEALDFAKLTAEANLSVGINSGGMLKGKEWHMHEDVSNSLAIAQSTVQ